MSLLPALLCVVSCPPQAGPAPLPPVPITAAEHHLERTWWDTSTPGEVWVRGRTFKASFGPRGVRYFPFVGGQAPRSVPLALALKEVAVGGERLALDASARPVRDGDAVTFGRGPLDEAYRVGLESVEQTFVLAEPLAGEVEITVAVSCELPREAREGGQVFRGTHGGVHLSGAFAVDAAGTRTPL